MLRFDYKPTTREELVELFKQQEWFEEYVKNTDKDLDSLFKYDCPIGWVDLGFMWKDTPQGYKYWKEIHNEWKSKCALYVGSEGEDDFRLFEQKSVDVEIDKIGAEFESSYEITEKALHNGVRIDSSSRENAKIKELQLSPINFDDFDAFVGTFIKIYRAGGTKFVQGQHDSASGSMHLHISLKNEKNLEEVAAQSVKMLAILKWFQRRISAPYWKPLFRCAVIPMAKITPKVPKDSKYNAITINCAEYNKPATIEFRINENPLPLWVYFVPFMLKRTDVEFYNQKEYWFKIKRELLDWVNETYTHEAQRKILSKYISSNLALNATYRYIKENFNY